MNILTQALRDYAVTENIATMDSHILVPESLACGLPKRPDLLGKIGNIGYEIDLEPVR